MPADFIPPRVCILICEIILTLPVRMDNPGFFFRLWLPLRLLQKVGVGEFNEQPAVDVVIQRLDADGGLKPFPPGQLQRHGGGDTSPGVSCPPGKRIGPGPSQF